MEACRTTVIGLELGEEEDPVVTSVLGQVRVWGKWWNRLRLEDQVEVTKVWSGIAW